MPKGNRLSKNEILRIRKLKKKGLKLVEIGKLLGVNERTVLRHTTDIPHPKRKLFVIKKDVTKLTINKAKILGYLSAEGCEVIGNYERFQFDKRRGKSYKERIKQHRIFFTNKDIVLKNDFLQSVQKCYGYTPYENGVADLVINAQAIIDDLVKYSRFGSRRWSVPAGVVNGADQIKEAWLRSYFDGDGSVDVVKKSIFAKSVNKEGLNEIKALLKSLGVVSHILGPYEGAHVLVIDSKDVYAKKIGFLSPKKSGKLALISN